MAKKPKKPIDAETALRTAVNLLCDALTNKQAELFERLQKGERLSDVELATYRVEISALDRTSDWANRQFNALYNFKHPIEQVEKGRKQLIENLLQGISQNDRLEIFGDSDIPDEVLKANY